MLFACGNDGCSVEMEREQMTAPDPCVGWVITPVLDISSYGEFDKIY